MATSHNGETIDATVIRPRRWWRKSAGVVGMFVGIIGLAALALYAGMHLRSAPPAFTAGVVTSDDLSRLREDVSADVSKALKPVTDRLAAVEETTAALTGELKNLSVTVTDSNKSATDLAGVVKDLKDGMATKEDVAAVNTRVGELEERMNTKFEEMAARVAALEELGVVSAPEPVVTIAISDIVRVCEAEWLKRMIDGAGEETVQEWLVGKSSEYLQDVLDSCPQVVAVTPKDPPPMAAVPTRPSDEQAEQWAADIRATCGVKNFSVALARGMGSMRVQSMLQDCSTMHTGIIEGPIVVPVSNKKPVRATGDGCAYVEVYTKTSTRVQITAPGRSQFVNIGPGVNRVCVPQSWFRLRYVAICLLDVRGKPKRTIEGGWMRTARANLASGNTANPGNPMFR